MYATTSTSTPTTAGSLQIYNWLRIMPLILRAYRPLRASLGLKPV